MLSHIRVSRSRTRASGRSREANRKKLCILIHPMMPTGMADQLREYVLGPIVGFLFDSTLAVARMCYDGPATATFPTSARSFRISGALSLPHGADRSGHHDFVACREKLDEPPSTYPQEALFRHRGFEPIHGEHGPGISLGRTTSHSARIILISRLPRRAPSRPSRQCASRTSEKQRIFSGTAMEILNNM